MKVLNVLKPVFVKKRNKTKKNPKNQKPQSTLEDTTALDFGTIRIEARDTCRPRYIKPDQFKFFKTSMKLC